LNDLTEITVSSLTGEFQRATDYAAEIHYVGARPVEEVHQILSANLPLKQGEKDSSSPEIIDKVNYTENTVLFLPNNDAKQSTVSFYIEGDDYPRENDPYTDAFNQYFGGGSFNSLVVQEIREYRSMAYSSGAAYYRPIINNKEAFFLGQLATQADKTNEAIDVFMDLINNMPQYPDRMENIKSYQKATASVEKPQFSSLSIIIEYLKRMGYSKSPAETNAEAIENLTFDDIVKFYNDNIKGRKIAIAIVGNPKNIDLKALEKYGKV
jgi:predicted Zn-dependent peptidase